MIVMIDLGVLEGWKAGGRAGGEGDTTDQGDADRFREVAMALRGQGGVGGV